MSHHPKGSGVMLSSTTPNARNTRSRSEGADQDEMIPLNDPFDMNPNTDWNTIFLRVSHGHRVRGRAV